MKKDSGSAKMTREVLAHIGRFVTVSFLCVILERSEESRSLFFGLFFVSFRAAAAKNPASLFLRPSTQDPKTGILRSADSALNDTRKDSGLNDTKRRRRNPESRRALSLDPHRLPLPDEERRQRVTRR